MSKEYLQTVLQQLYSEYSGKNKTKDAADFMKYINDYGNGKLFEGLSYSYDEGKDTNTLSKDKVFADGSTLLFESSAGDVISFNLNDVNLNSVSGKKDQAAQFDLMDDGVANGSITEDMLNGTTISVTKNGVNISGDNIDNTNSTTAASTNGDFSLSGADVKSLIAQIKGKSTADAEAIVKTFILSKFGGNTTDVLKNLTDYDYSNVGSEYLANARETALNSLISKITTQVKAAYSSISEDTDAVDVSINKYNSIKLTRDDYKDINFATKLTQNDVNSTEFLSYVRNKFGNQNIQASDITIDANGNISAKATNTGTIKPGTTKLSDSNTQFTLSAADIKAIKDLIDSGKTCEEAMKQYFGSTDSIISKLGLSASGTAAAKETAIASAANIIAGKISSGVADSSPGTGLSITNYYDVQFSKTDLAQVSSKYTTDTYGEGTTVTTLNNGLVVVTPKDAKTWQGEGKGNYGKIDWNGDGKFGDESKRGNAYDNYLTYHGDLDNFIRTGMGSSFTDYNIADVKKVVDAKLGATATGPVTIGNETVDKISDTQYGIHITSHDMVQANGFDSYNYAIYDTEKNQYLVGTLDDKGVFKVQGIVENVARKIASPLILDTDHDGQVEAEWGTGVDIDGNGTADGAASGGDKMLAMGDLNGDGKITGDEVFGDQTVDPFTGKKLNASNGFEALKMVAESAEKYSGISCMKDGTVDVKKLKEILELTGKGSLGLISGGNVTSLEDLGKIATIDVSDYTENNADQGKNIQHNQQGLFTEDDGTKHEVDDVWFGLA